jgi:hypothetical protein
MLKRQHEVVEKMDVNLQVTNEMLGNYSRKYLSDLAVQKANKLLIKYFDEKIELKKLESAGKVLKGSEEEKSLVGNMKKIQYDATS